MMSEATANINKAIPNQHSQTIRNFYQTLKKHVNMQKQEAVKMFTQHFISYGKCTFGRGKNNKGVIYNKHKTN